MSEEEKKERLLNSIAKGCDGSIADEVNAIIIKQQKEINREKQYTDFYKDLCNKQQKLINQLLEDMKERANNFSYESEIMWRKIEKAEKLLEEK